MSATNKNNIFIDTNVLIGAWSGKKPDSNCLDYLFSLTGKRLFISSLSVAQLVSVFQKKKNNAEIKKIVRYLLSKFTVLSFTDKDIEDSLNIENSDMEDNIQYIISRKFNCLHFVTNNKKDYNRFYILNIIMPSQIRVIKRD
ncbi:MAG: PIN domain-containing protein [Candidatus Symbiothrix sp.]|jgi:predicted nucleic acid-binding protein|nr:PIN domain-containing protein [Candidatus Symbiothrix sp.]